MFGKVNVLLLAVFGAILGMQLFWSWDAPEAPVADTPAVAAAARSQVAPRPAAVEPATVPTPQPAEIADAATDAPLVALDQTPEVAAAQEDPKVVQAGMAPTPLTDETARADEKAAEEPLPANRPAGLLVTYAETLSIRFHGYGEISGIYRVNDDETVSIPVIDRVSVSGLTAAELEAALAQRVFELTGRRSDVTVEVERYQPVFVSGGVAAPGSFAWRRNMTVMHAVALAGGLYRSPERRRTSLGLIDARLSVEKSLAELKRAIVRSARLKAERDNVDYIELPQRLVDLAGDEGARRLIESEQALLVAARAAAALELDAVEASLRAARDEVVRLNEFGETLEAKLAERRAFIERMTKLESRGYVSEERMTELRTSVIDLETKLATVRVSISRAEAARLSLERDRIKLVQSRTAQVTEELVAIEAEIEAKALAYEAALARRTEMVSSQDAAAIADEGADNAITYSVVRRTAFGIETLKVTPFEKLLPGDIVMIDARRPSLDDEAKATSGSRSFAQAGE